MAMSVVTIHAKLPSFPTTNYQIIPTIAVKINPTSTGSQLTKLSSQRWLALEIVVRFVVMHVAQEITDIFKQRFRSRRILSSELRTRAGFFWLVDLINPVSVHISDEAPFAAAPPDFEAQLVCEI